MKADWDGMCIDGVMPAVSLFATGLEQVVCLTNQRFDSAQQFVCVSGGVKHHAVSCITHDTHVCPLNFTPMLSRILHRPALHPLRAAPSLRWWRHPPLAQHCVDQVIACECCCHSHCITQCIGIMSCSLGTLCACTAASTGTGDHV